MAANQVLLLALRAENSDLKRKLTDAEKHAKKTTKGMQGAFSKLNFRNFLYGSFGIYAVQRGLKQVMKPAMDFERQLAKVSTMLEKSSMKSMNNYSKGLQTLSIQFAESTKTLSKGLYDILSASVAPAKAMYVLEISSRAAVAGMTTTAVAADVITTIMNSYNMAVEEAAHISDVLFATVKRGKTEFPELATAIGMVAATAAQVGLSFEEMQASISTMTRQGINVHRATIALMNILNAFLTPTDAAREAAKLFGIELTTAWLAANKFAGMMIRLKDATSEQVAAIFPSVRGLRGMNAALGDVSGFLRDLNLNMNATGLTMEAFAKMSKTTWFNVKQLSQQIIVLVVYFGSRFLPKLAKVTKQIKDWIWQNEKLIKQDLKKWGDRIIKFLATMYKYRDVIKVAFVAFLSGSLATSIYGVAVAFNVLKVAMAAAGLGGVISAGGVAGLGAAAVGGAVYGAGKFQEKYRSPKRHISGYGVEMMPMTSYVYGAAKRAEQSALRRTKRFDFRRKRDPLSLVIKGKEKVAALPPPKPMSAESIEAFKEYMQTFKDGMDEIESIERETASARLGIIKNNTQRLIAEEKLRFKFEKEDMQQKHGALYKTLGIEAKLIETHKANITVIEQKAAVENQQRLSDLRHRANVSRIQLEYDGAEERIKILEIERDREISVEVERYNTIVETKRAIADINEYYNNLIADSNASTINTMAQGWYNLSQQMSTYMANAAIQSGNVFKNIGKAFEQMLIKMAADFAAKAVVFSLLSMFMPGSFAFGGVGKVIGGEIAVGFKKFLGFAQGGMAYTPQLAMVGEGGPERILNPEETRQYNKNISNDNSRLTINFNGSVDPSMDIVEQLEVASRDGRLDFLFGRG